MLGRPTCSHHLHHVRAHRWNREDVTPVCGDCGYELTWTLADVPPCPGPEFVLVRRSAGRHRAEERR